MARLYIKTHWSSYYNVTLTLTANKSTKIKFSTEKIYYNMFTYALHIHTRYSVADLLSLTIILSIFTDFFLFYKLYQS